MSDYCMLFSQTFLRLTIIPINQDRRPAWKLVKIDVASSLHTSYLFKLFFFTNLHSHTPELAFSRWKEALK